MHPNYSNSFSQAYNPYGFAQNFANLNLNAGQYHYQNQQRYQQNSSYGNRFFVADDPNIVDIGTYVAPSLNDPEEKWATTADVEAAYQRGSTAVRQENNTMIDDYYKKFTAPITDYIPISTNGQPTYVYQNLDGTSAGNTASADKKSATNGGHPPSKDKSNGSKKSEKKDKHKSRKSSTSKANHGATKAQNDEVKSVAPQSADAVSSDAQQQASTIARSDTSQSGIQSQTLVSSAQPVQQQQQAPSAQQILVPTLPHGQQIQQAPPTQANPVPVVHQAQQPQQAPPAQRIPVPVMHHAQQQQAVPPAQKVPMQQQMIRTQQLAQQPQIRQQIPPQQQQLALGQRMPIPVQNQAPPMQRIIHQAAQPIRPQQGVQHQQPSIQQQQAITSAPANQANAENDQIPMKNDSNPVVYFDIEIDGEKRGRLVMELFQHALPITTKNFLALCTNEFQFGYRLSYFHRIIPGFMAQGGDFEKSDGTGGYSIYGEKFNDEGFPFKHDRPGLLSMANSGPNTNGSQFFITFVPCPHLDNKHVVFGQILKGFHLLTDLQMSGTDEGEIVREVKIADCGRLQ